jgi:hypothetical protein
MWRDPGRRHINLAASLAFAKRAFSALVIENTALREDLTRVRLQRDEALDMVRQLRVCIQERWRAEERCRELYRERDIARAEAAQRNPDMPLH